MSAPKELTHTSPQFSAAELEKLAKTADALSAYMGKPVLAEVVLGDEGTEWVTFGVPQDTQAKSDATQTHVQLGGPGARLLGNRGGLPLTDNDSYDCLYLWAIQISLDAHERFIKLDQNGEASAWSDVLDDVLPFVLSEADMDETLEDEDESEDQAESHLPGPHSIH